MTELLNQNGDKIMLAAFVVFALFLHVIFKRESMLKCPKWVAGWLWGYLSPAIASLVFNGVLWLALAAWLYTGKEDYRQLLLPVTSIGLGWIVAELIKGFTSSRVSHWVVGLGCCFLNLLNTLPTGRILYEILNSKVHAPQLGEIVVTPYSLIKAFIVLWAFFLIMGSIVDPLENYLRKHHHLKPSSRSLLIKMFRIVLYAAIGLLALNTLGIDLTTLTVFSGAVGVGLGFGLQKIASNFVSGIILLLEHSVEEGDLVELNDGTLGFIRKSNARFTLIETFDSKEILVPNEDLIISRVINWTHSNAVGRIEVEVGVSYNSDLEFVRELILDAATGHPLCLSDPGPACYLHEFGDNSVNFTLHFWVSDIKVGRLRPRDTVMTAIWHSFQEHGIEIPFPQRDLHLKSHPDIFRQGALNFHEASGNS